MPCASDALTLVQLSSMLLVERKAIPREDDWLYEIKYDGYRVLASTGSDARLQSRGGIDATRWFPEVVATSALSPTCLPVQSWIAKSASWTISAGVTSIASTQGRGERVGTKAPILSSTACSTS